MPKLNLDNPVFRAMSWLGDMVFLNLLWVLCCLPLVTAGASTAALLTVARRLVSGEICRIGRDFFHAFRLNWRQATKTWLILAAAGVLFAADLLITFQMPGALNNLLRGPSAVLCVVWLTVTGNAFALLARYLHKLGSLSYSTKGEHRGMGLHLAAQTLHHYKNIEKDTTYENHVFTQTLKIFDE